MIDWYARAEEKLTSGLKEVKGNRENVMKKPVQETLLSFCRQSEAFAKTVAEGGSFADCMTAVAKNVGSSISDLDAFRKAVAFYFPKAHIELAMTIDLPEETKPRSPGIVLDLADFIS